VKLRCEEGVLIQRREVLGRSVEVSHINCQPVKSGILVSVVLSFVAQSFEYEANKFVLSHMVFSHELHICATCTWREKYFPKCLPGIGNMTCRERSRAGCVEAVFFKTISSLFSIEVVSMREVHRTASLTS
jgi:hypothetical protein